MKLILSKTRAIDFRVSTLPMVNGEKIVMRILDPSSAMLGIDADPLRSREHILLVNLLIGSLPGIYAGSHLTGAIPDKALRPALAVGTKSLESVGV